MPIHPNQLRMRAQRIVQERTLDLRGLPFRKQPAVTATLDAVNTENHLTALMLQDAAAEIERLQKLIPQPPTFRIVTALDGSYFMQREDTHTNCSVVACGMDHETAKTLLTALIRYNPKRNECA
jgi:hypothetical protein